ncbi:unnamed protein product, partial [Owenia fusiformis]
MANSPRPGVWVLEKSADFGKTFTPWQYFADTNSDCNTLFGLPSRGRLDRDDSVICTTHYSKVVPLEGGEIVVSLVNGRPNANDFSNSESLQAWTLATHVRLRFLRTKTLLGHLMALARQDPTVTRRYYYSIKDISIGGRCVCNGHADVCDKTDPMNPNKLICRCRNETNTCGDQCDECCPGFVQKKWQKSSRYVTNPCEPCNCHSHTTECVYNEEVAQNRTSLDIYGNYEGGGVCQNCQHNTEGINCERCKFGYYRPEGTPLDSPFVCVRCRCDPTYSTGDCEDGTGRCKCRQEYTGENCDRCAPGYYGYPRCVPCDCNVNGTQPGNCEAIRGTCPCKVGYAGDLCDQCDYGYYGFPNCRSCACDRTGSLGSGCDVTTGQCTCSNSYGGLTCGECANGYYNFPSCDYCGCDMIGSAEEVCDKLFGQCICKENYGGDRCDRCAPGYYNYPTCMECQCTDPGSRGNSCDDRGQCYCNPEYGGQLCQNCAPGYFKYPECNSCDCDPYGSYGISCDQEGGDCTCRYNFEGVNCDKCKEGFYNYPVCEECNCNPAGARTIPGLPIGGCGSFSNGQLCECKDKVQGHICDTCKPGYWNLNVNNPQGCETCNCHTPGTIGGTSDCKSADGQCVCKTFTTDRQCSDCTPGTYDLQEYNLFGCTNCQCDVGGALDNTCRQSDGQCSCRPRIRGRQCDKPISKHFFPTLHENKFEFEDGRTSTGGKVRYNFDSNAFPDYSWRGYAIMSRLQEEVLVDVDITKPSLYRLVFRYVSRNSAPITAEVTVTPDTSVDAEQSSSVTFESTYSPQFVTVAGTGGIATFVLNPGRWSISVKTAENVLLDYLVLLPQAYYEATILQEFVSQPCVVPDNGQPCRHYTYVDLANFEKARAEEGSVTVNQERRRVTTSSDRETADALGVPYLTPLNRDQNSINLNVRVAKSGQYVLVVRYRNTRPKQTQTINFDVATRGARGTGSADMYACPFSALCQQVIKDGDDMVGIYTIDGDYASITISGNRNTDLLLDSVIAIPIAEWDINYLKPRLECVRQGTVCMEGMYSSATGAVKTEFESGENSGRVSQTLPPKIIDTSIKVVKLDRREPNIRVNVQVLNPGKHVFIVQYYQPSGVDYDINVIVEADGQSSQGRFKAEYCPGVSGCRGVITFEDVNHLDISNTDVRIIFNNTEGRTLFVDYILSVPAEHFTPNLLEFGAMDKTGQFFTRCAGKNFEINPADVGPGFCRRAVFTLTTEYNNGASPCGCDVDGSTSFSCNEFGGQCQCKPYIIGRTCSQCRTGYYDFPNCKRCNCPSGLCEPRTGRCVCPERVTGENCDTCLPRTFGYDPLIGCEDCNCDRQGVRGRNMNCDVNTGACDCKDNVGGRRCNFCLAGYYGFPGCAECNCDRRGTMPDICDQQSARCICKENVEGRQCEQCKPATFYLESRNPEGCTKCFCFGATNVCEKSQLRRSQFRHMANWMVTNVYDPRIDERGQTISLEVRDNIIDANKAIYWVAPSRYNGNRVTSYGGKLTYTVLFTIPRRGNSEGLIEDDVILVGNNMTIVHLSETQPSPGYPLTVEVDLLERHFTHADSNNDVSREQFMTILARLESIKIRASYYTVIEQASLSDASLDIASRSGSGMAAHNVEVCECPPRYTGSSCESCIEGYYHGSGPYLGDCVECNCNGHSDRCDSETGVCVDCLHNTDGPNCEVCKEGYYRDQRTQECKICSCPQGVEGNNFATTCEVSGGGTVVKCSCKPGYTGQFCEVCDLGFWGDPNIPGGECKPCGCSGNINLMDPSSCDKATGGCLRCINNSTGPNCEQCADWFWGDALARDCRGCTCDQCGSRSCDKFTGTCNCQNNVIGRDCNQCAPYTFGFDSCNGCERCDCAEGSLSDDCDISSGQCECAPGVTGRQCNQCKRGYWNYGRNGCEKCDCEYEGATTCDQSTGECICLPGVTGPKCDMCLPRWAPVENEGCVECDTCTHLLLDEIEILDYNLTYVIKDLENVAVGVAAYKRLNAINRTVTELRPRVDNLIPPTAVELDPLKKEVEEAKRMSERVGRRAGDTVDEAQGLNEDTQNFVEEITSMGPSVAMSLEMSRKAVEFAKEVLADLLGRIGNTNVAKLVEEAEKILKEIQDRDFTERDDQARIELTEAIDALNRVKDLAKRANDQMNRTMEITDNIDDIEAKLLDLQKNNRKSMDDSMLADDMMLKNNMTMRMIIEDIAKSNTLKDDCRMVLDMAKDLLEQAKEFLRNATIAFDELDQASSELDGAMLKLRDFINTRKMENENLRPCVEKGTIHARNLTSDADLLEKTFAGVRNLSEDALRAANAYKDIVDAINAALKAAEAAVDAAMEALTNSEGLGERARKSRRKSERLLREANEASDKVENDLRNQLDSAKQSVSNLDDQLKRARDLLNMLLDGLDTLPEDGFGEEAQKAADKAMDAQTRATNAKDQIQDILDELPEDKIKVQQIPEDILAANKAIDRAKAQVEKVQDMVPKAVNLMENLNVTKEMVERLGKSVKVDLEDLKNNIRLARFEASRIKVGVRYKSDSTLQVRNPDGLGDKGSRTRVELFFRTTERDGFLMYLGSDAPRSGLNIGVDYFALEIIDGKVVFKYNLGSGAAVITHPKDVEKDKWHHVIAERSGKKGTLLVQTPEDLDEEEAVTVTGESRGTMSILSLDKETTKFFVGGVPDTSNINDIISRKFVGCIEDVTVDYVPIGLWDFVTAANIDEGCSPRKKPDAITVSEYKFDGNGYIVIDAARFRPAKKSNIKLKFKSYAPNGLLFFMGKGTDFMSIELKDGKIFYQYDLGKGRAFLETPKRYNDGQWHEIQAIRKEQSGLLIIDGETDSQIRGDSPGDMTEMSFTNEVFIGGMRKGFSIAGVSSQGLIGCITSVQFDGNEKDLGSNLEAVGVSPGCSDEAKVFSIEEDAPGYVAMPTVNVGKVYEMTFRFKSNKEDGIMMYSANDDQSQAFSVSMVDGRIAIGVVPGNGKLSTVNSGGNTYNDGKWHYVSLKKEDLTVTLNIDDKENIQGPITGTRRRKLSTNSYQYYGGVPDDYTIVEQNIPTVKPFAGCIGDVTVNGSYLNFADKKESFNVQLAVCTLVDMTPPPTLPPTSPPTKLPSGEIITPPRYSYTWVEDFIARDQDAFKFRVRAG